MDHPPTKSVPLPGAAEPMLRLVADNGTPINNRRVPLPDDKTAQLRAIVATINSEIARLPRPAASGVAEQSSDELIVSWNTLVDLLALGPAPETRACPACAHIGMLAATRCGYCWTPLQPPTPAGVDTR
jgi:hypothetical protein